MGRSSQSRHSTSTVIRGRPHKAMLRKLSGGREGSISEYKRLIQEQLFYSMNSDTHIKYPRISPVDRASEWKCRHAVNRRRRLTSVRRSMLTMGGCSDFQILIEKCR